MKTIIELTEKDILNILAEKFKTDEYNVKMNITEGWRGVHNDERKVPVVSAKVALECMKVNV